ncbi:MAG TPA: oligosaccharide flippase family protein [Hyphomicrobiales bacterium]|nr:oligosaccharide flippase family protein [Hyphomicrobiales bacterium]
MTGIRRALLFSSLDRYLVLLANLAAMAAVSRLLTPEEIGLSIIATTALATAESLRDFGTVAFLIQRAEISRPVVQTAFTVTLAMSAALAALLWLAAEPFARLYHQAGIVPYLHVVAVAFLAGSLAGPVMALMRRDMAFGKLALINVTTATATAAVTVALALLGFSYMSFAWAGLATAVVATALALALRPDFWIFRPRLDEWRNILHFGGYSTATAVLVRASDLLPALLLGRIMNLEAVGLFSRALMLAQLPDRVVLTLLRPIALPAFAAAGRLGDDLKPVYLGAVGFVAAAWMPILATLALLAYPAVEITLGPGWDAVVPLVRIMAVGFLPYFLVAGLGYALLVAAGAVHQTTMLNLIFLPIRLALIGGASFLGLEAVAWSTAATNVILVVMCLVAIRRHVDFTWGELAGAMGRSIVVTLCTLAGPLLVIALNGFDLALSQMAGVGAGALAGLCWILGLFAARHPLADEIRRALATMRGLRAPRVPEIRPT